MKRFRIVKDGIVAWEACQFTDGSAVSLDYEAGEGGFCESIPEAWQDRSSDNAPAPWPRIFHLLRQEDATGNTGTGIVAEGVRFTDGTAVLRWLSETPSFVVYSGPEGVKAVERVHGHGGHTRVIFRGDPA